MLKRLIITKADGYTTVTIDKYHKRAQGKRTYTPSLESLLRLDSLLQKSEYYCKYALESWTQITIWQDRIELGYMYSNPKIEPEPVEPKCEYCNNPLELSCSYCY